MRTANTLRAGELGLWSSVAEAEAYYDTYFPRIYAYFVRRVGSPSLAEDLTSETFERILRSAPEFEVTGNVEVAVRVWTYRIAGNVFRNHLRANERETFRIERWQRQQRGTVDGPGIEFAVSLEDAIGELSASDREVLALRYWDGLTAPEIASVVGCRQRQVYSTLDRCVRQLRRQLALPHQTPVAGSLP